jgi:hypothetical protein
MSNWYKITAEMEADRRNLTGPEREGFIAGCLYAARQLDSPAPDGRDFAEWWDRRFPNIQR